MTLTNFILFAIILLLLKIIIENKQIFKRKGQTMKSLTAKQIGEKFGKTPKEINEIFDDLDFLKKSDCGYTVTKKGQINGGIQKKYMGNDYVAWNEEILNNKLFIKSLKPQSEQVENKDENDFRTKFKAEYRTKDGHYVRSRAEVIIADWLYSEFVTYAYEKSVPIKEEMYCDFYIPQGKVYIEFWGLEDEKYLNRKQYKQQLYKQNGLNLIEIGNNEINNIDDFLPKELLKFGIKIA